MSRPAALLPLVPATAVVFARRHRAPTTRTAEVNALVEVLGNLRSRFEAIPVTADTDLSPYGLTRPEVTVKLRTDNEKYFQFNLGEAAATIRQTTASRRTQDIRIDPQTFRSPYGWDGRAPWET